MAKTLMSTVTNQILYQSGNVGPRWCRVNGTDIYPGSIVTMTGETIHTVDIDIPGAIDEKTMGIVGLLPNWDIDTVYTDNKLVPVYEVGTEAIAWGWIQANDGDKKAGDPLNHSAASADGFAIAGELVTEWVGTVYEDCTVSATDDTPCLIWLK